jgi:hypothetical protein
MIDRPSDDFDLQGWLELILGLDRVAGRALALLDDEREAPRPAAADALVDAVLGIEVLARRVRALAARLDEDGRMTSKREGPSGPPFDGDGWLR